MHDIKGVVYGKVTPTMRKECNHKLEAWKCFSLILKKRTFDIYCPDEREIFYLIPGISLCLREIDYSHPKYQVERSHPKKEGRACNKVVFGGREVDRFYSMGRMLWRRFLLRIKQEYIHNKKHEVYHRYSN
jgi:hypothetical protein